MQACKLIMFYYACTHVRSRVWSGSAAKGVLRKRAQIGAPVRKGMRARDLIAFCANDGPVPGIHSDRNIIESED